MLDPHLQGFHEGFSARLGNGAQIVDKICLCHSDTSVHQSEGAVMGIGNDIYFQFLATFQL